MSGWLLVAVVVAGGYLLGAIPFGLIVTARAGAGDLRDIGSGNIGATNVLRTGRKDLAALTLLLDAGKGAFAVFLADYLAPGFGPVAAVAAFFGHLFPIWLRFHGGKGVATYLGVVLALHWPCGLVALAVWLGAALTTRYSSVGAIAAAVITPVVAAFFFRPDLTLLFLAMSLMVLWKHSDNIARLLEGTEPRVGKRPAG